MSFEQVRSQSLEKTLKFGFRKIWECTKFNNLSRDEDFGQKVREYGMAWKCTKISVSYRFAHQKHRRWFVIRGNQVTDSENHPISKMHYKLNKQQNAFILFVYFLFILKYHLLFLLETLDYVILSRIGTSLRLQELVQSIKYY